MSLPNIALVSPAASEATAEPSRSHVEVGHSVQFYENDQFLAAAVTDFLADGLEHGQRLIVLATEANRHAFATRLRARGIDVDQATRLAQLTMLDARETLSMFMIGETPDPTRFREIIGAVIDNSQRGDRLAGLRLYGEMVDVLWKEGNTDGAIRLEELWNDLGNTYRFNLLCAYSMGNFYKASDAEKFRDICARHSHVVPTEQYTEAAAEARAIEISRLQQQARALQTEILHRREMEDRLRDALLAAQQAEAEAEAANRAKGQFLASMSHELRTPLNAILGYAELVEIGIHGPVTAGQRGAMQRLRQSAEHLLGLIGEVLDFAKIEAGAVQYEIAPVPMDELLSGIETLIAPQIAARQLRYHHERCDAAITAAADADKVKQIVLNLLSNAIKFTPAGGEISLTCAAHGDRVRVDVRDTGIGVAPDMVDAIFEPFVQAGRRLNRPADGVGLGLAISRDMARAMGGNLTAESRVGEGSVFTLTLPRR